MITVSDLLPLTPEIFLLSATCVLLLADLFISDARRGLTHFLGILTLVATAALVLRDGVATDQVSAFGGMFLRDGLADVLKVFMLLVTGAAFVYAKPYLMDRGLFKGEFYVLALFAVLGMMVLVSAGNLLSLYIGLELLALSSYALVALDRDNRLATEAAMKYFVLGSLASGMLLYGMSMVYGATGSLDIASIHASLDGLGENRGILLLGVVFLVVGIAFKFGAAPFHMWLPDVYQGAPTAVTAFIASAPKLAAFGMAYRLLEGAVGDIADWRIMLAWLAVLSLAIGNVVAIAQTNFKRMLAYSTISHVGFLFLGLAAGTPQGYGAAMFYAIAYAIMSVGGFAAILLLARRGFEAEEISDFRGLNQRHPWFAFMVLLIMSSMAGIPVLLGFWAKLFVLQAAVQADLLWLAIVAVVFAVIGAYYYLRVIRTMYFDSPDEAQAAQPLSTDPQLRWLLTVNGLAMLGLGLFSGPLLTWCMRATGALG